MTRQEYQREKVYGQKYKLNFWKIWTDRPYVATGVAVALILALVTKQFLLLVLLLILTGIGIYIIGHSHHPGRVLSIEFHLKASRQLSMLKSLQMGASIIMFLATYMRKVVNVNFSSAGTQDGLQTIQGLLSNTGKYGQQGSYILGLLNTVTGGSFWGSYRYASNTSQFMNDPAGLMIILWIFLLMIAPALCVLSNFFKEPYSRRVSLGAGIVSFASLAATPTLMKYLVEKYAQDQNISVSNALSVGDMAYLAIFCSIAVVAIAIYRMYKQDKI
ncbi:cytochrome C5 [Lactobacillus psittaci]|nr:cytochrome C5 [Lactobacillus psittaci]